VRCLSPFRIGGKPRQEKDAMPRETTQRELDNDNRHLRLRIARLRRRIDGRLHGVQREGRRLASWKTYVRTFPGSALLIALGAGLAVSAGLGRGQLTRMVGLRLFRRGTASLSGQLVAHLQDIWAATDPSPRSEESQEDDREQT